MPVARIVTCVLLAGCAPVMRPSDDAGGVADDAATSPDAADSADASERLELDATLPVELDAGDPPTCVCTPTSICVEAFCEDGACVELPRPDGLLCGEGSDHVCVDGACVARFGCGDGYREPGPEPPREACDDGNASGGDACSDACEPVLQEITSEEAALAPQIGIDARGRALLVWVEAGDSQRVLALRFDRGGRRIDELPFVIATPSVATEVAITGARFGWLVAYTEAGPDLSDVFLRHVAADATLSPPRRANVSTDARQDGPRLATTASGVIAVWRDESPVLGGGGARIVARRFDLRGAPLGPELIVDGEHDDAAPALDANDDGFLVAWTRAAQTPVVMARAFRANGTPRGAGTMLGEGFDPQVGAGDDGYAIAWTTRAADSRGDVVVAVTDREGVLIEAGAAVAASASPEEHGVAALTALGAMVLHARGDGVVGRLRDLELVTTGWELPPESAPLVEALRAVSTQSAGAVARAHDGYWLLWNDDQTGRTAIRAFRLAIDGRTP